MTTLSTQPLLKISDVAKRLGVSPATVRRWVDFGKLRSFRAGGSIRISAEDLQSFVNVNEPKATAVSA
jgi:excisionase family DNA binding protein